MPQPAKNHPSYLILQSFLPAGEFKQNMLGIVVNDIKNPKDECFEWKTAKAIAAIQERSYFVEESDFTIDSVRNAEVEIKAKLGNLFKASVSESQKDADKLSSSRVQTHRLQKHPKDLLGDSDCKKDKDNLVKHLAANKGRGYMLVGFKTAVDGRYSKSRETNQDEAAFAQAPFQTILQAIGIPSSYTADFATPSVDVTNKRDTRTATSGVVQGETIFAAQYRPIWLRKSSSGDVAFEAIQVYDSDAATFGPKDESVVGELDIHEHMKQNGLQLLEDDEDTDTDAECDSDVDIEVAGMLVQGQPGLGVKQALSFVPETWP